MQDNTIKEAKDLVRKAVETYLAKDDNKNYILPMEKQRPLFINGPAGVGKTDIVYQVAKEMQIGFVSYNLTHHTRQSAIGMPSIVNREVNGTEYEATEYTMSEIIDSVYGEIEKGITEGILFVDEINCVSETLSPVLLQFLQKKSFGPHKVPKGWVIVTAGNPSKFNKSAKTFDAVTLDRLRVINVAPDLDAWLEYAVDNHIQCSIINYLQSFSKYFYIFEKSVNATSIVTPRSWEDLSNAMSMAKKLGHEITLSLIAQFIQNEQCAMDFLSHYVLLKNCISKDEIEDILAGKRKEFLKKKLKSMNFQLRWAVTTILLSKLSSLAEPLSKEILEPKDEDDMLMEKIEYWHEEYTNVLELLVEAFGKGCEVEHYLSLSCRVKAIGLLLMKKKNDLYFSLFHEMTISSEAWKKMVNQTKEKIKLEKEAV